MDFSMKNNKMMPTYLQNWIDRSSSPPMEIIIDGTGVNENPAAAYRGFGCITANNSSRLLLDYKVEHPDAYKEIMRLLFEKNYGAGITHIKIELGADVNSSSGTEPCSKRTANEPADVTRGAGFQFAADAKAINPAITLDLLRWGEPGWIAKSFAISQEHGMNARYRWYKETLDAAYRVYGLKFDYISADQNETDTPDESWILYFRYRLDNEKDAPYDYSKIKLVASDEVGTRHIAEQMVDSSDLRNAVDVIGLHYTTFGDSYTNLLNEAYGKEIWYSEGSSPCNVPELTVQADGSGLTGRNGTIDIANRIINSYYNGKMVMYEFQPAVASYYDGSCYAPKQLIRAWEPWSGHYVLDAGFWMAMHFSRFAEKGWMYIGGACFGDGEEDHSISNTTHNFMTLTSPDRDNFSMFFTNDSDETRTYNVIVRDMAIEPTSLSTVITRGPSGRQAYNANWFRQGKTVRMTRQSGRHMFVIKVPPYSIMTATTLDTSWVNGVQTFKEIHPAGTTRLPLPYHDDLKYTPNEIRIRGCSPRYMTDQGGAFELVDTDDGYAICQMITPQTMPTNWRYRGTPQPITCFGDDKWRCYSMEAEVKLSDAEPHNYAGIGVRYNSAVTCEYTSLCGYAGRIYGDGSWKLMDMESVAAEGFLPDIDPTKWNALKLVIIGNSIFFFLNGNLLTKYTPQCMVNSGRASLCSEYAWNLFRNIHIDPLSVQPAYVRRVDCFGDGILYSENWKVHAMESYRFYNRTSMEAQPGANFSCDFEGVGIAAIGTAQNADLTVLIDGHTLYENLYVADCSARQAIFSVESLPEGVHKLQVYVNSGNLKLDALEVPEAYSKMPDTLVLPANLRQSVLEQRRRQSASRQAQSEMMDADQILEHIAHPFETPAQSNPAETQPVTEKTPTEPQQPTSEETAEVQQPITETPVETQQPVTEAAPVEAQQPVEQETPVETQQPTVETQPAADEKPAKTAQELEEERLFEIYDRMFADDDVPPMETNAETLSSDLDAFFNEDNTDVDHTSGPEQS